MQRFFVEPFQVLEEEHRITLTGPDLNHMKNVLRMRIGEDVWISDGSEKEYHCTIEEFQGTAQFFISFMLRNPSMSSQAGFICSRDFPKGIKWN